MSEMTTEMMLRHIGEVGDKISFRNVVVTDLQNIGVKVQKPRRKSGSHLGKDKPHGSSSTSSSAPTTPSIFQRPLDEVPSSVFTDKLLGNMFVPSFLVAAFDLLRHHYELEGIFRKSGSVQRQKDLKSRIEAGVMDFSDAQPSDMTSVVKEFFRNLPEPLLPFHFHDAFFKVMSFPSDVIDPSSNLTKEDAFSMLCCLLPMTHLTTLRFVLIELSQIAIGEENKMDVMNLSVIMTPNFMPAPIDEKEGKSSVSSQGEESKSLERRTNVVAFLLKMAKKIGSVPSSVFERATMMSTLFPSPSSGGDDDRNDETDQGEEKPKLKRKKRSASFSGLVSGLSEGIAWLKGSRSNINTSYTVTCEPVSHPQPPNSHHQPVLAHHGRVPQHHPPAAGLPPPTPRSARTPHKGLDGGMEPYTPKIMGGANAISSHQGNADSVGGSNMKRRAALLGNKTNSPLLPVTPSINRRANNTTGQSSPLLQSRQPRPRHRSRHGTSDQVLGDNSAMLSVSESIKLKRNSSGGRMEGSSKQQYRQQQQQTRSVGDEETDWNSNCGSTDAVGSESTDDVREGKGHGKHRRARSLIKMLGSSFTKSEESIISAKSEDGLSRETSASSMNSVASKFRKSGFFNKGNRNNAGGRRHKKHPSSPAGTSFVPRRGQQQDADSSMGLRVTRSSDDLTGDDEGKCIASLMNAASASVSTPADLDDTVDFLSQPNLHDDTNTSSNYDDTRSNDVTREDESRSNNDVTGDDLDCEDDDDDCAIAPMPEPQEISLINKFHIGLEDMEATISLSPAVVASRPMNALLFQANANLANSAVTPGRGQIMSYLTKMAAMPGTGESMEIDAEEGSDFELRRRVLQPGCVTPSQKWRNFDSPSSSSPPGFGQNFVPRTPGSSGGSPSGITRRRSLSEGDKDAIVAFARISGLKRGQPNSQQSGLPSPLIIDEKRRSWRSSIPGMQKLEEDDDEIIYNYDDDDEIIFDADEHGAGDALKHLESPVDENLDDPSSQHPMKGRDALKELASRYHDMEAEMQMEEEEEDGESHHPVGEVLDGIHLEDDDDDEKLGDEGKDESIKSNDRSSSLKKSISATSTASTASAVSNSSSGGSSYIGDDRDSLNSYSSATSVLSAMSLGAATITSVQVVEEEEEETREEDEEEELILEPSAENSSLLRAIEAHLKANNVIDSDDVVCGVDDVDGGVHGVEDASTASATTSIPSQSVVAEPASVGCLSPIDGQEMEEELETESLRKEIREEDSRGERFKAPTVKVKRKKSLKGANITVTKGTHAVLERNKMLAKLPDVQLQPSSPVGPKTTAPPVFPVLDISEVSRNAKRGSVINLQRSGNVAQRVARFQQIAKSNVDQCLEKSTLSAIQRPRNHQPTDSQQQPQLPRIRSVEREKRPSSSKSRPPSSSRSSPAKSAASLRVEALTSKAGGGGATSSSRRAARLPISAGSMVRPAADLVSDKTAAAAKRTASSSCSSGSSGIPVYSRKFSSPARSSSSSSSSSKNGSKGVDGSSSVLQKDRLLKDSTNLTDALSTASSVVFTAASDETFHNESNRTVMRKRDRDAAASVDSTDLLASSTGYLGTSTNPTAVSLESGGFNDDLEPLRKSPRKSPLPL